MTSDSSATCHWDMLVGFYGPIAPPGPNAPSSECPSNVVPNSEFERAQIPNFRTRSIPNLWTRPMSGVSRPYLRYGYRGRLQNVSPPSVLFESSQIFLQYTGDTDAKKWWTRILKFSFCDFNEFSEIFKKASRGHSAADLDHYGRGQTRSE